MTIRILTTPEEVRALAPRWEAFGPSRTASPDVFLDEAATVPTVIAPRVFAAFRGDDLVALLVARLDVCEYRLTVARRTFHRRSLRTLTVVAGGALRRDSAVPWRPLLEAAAADLQAGTVEAVRYCRVPTPSDSLDAIREQSPRVWRDESAAPLGHWKLDLPASYDELLRRVSRHSRKHFRRWRERLEERHPGRVEVRRTRSAGDVADLCRRVDELARRTYQRGMDAGFVHEAKTERLLSLAAEKDTLLAYELIVEGRTASFWIGMRHRETACLEATGFDREFAAFEPGTLLLLDLLRDAIGEGVRHVDYGLGDYDYKRRFGATRTEVREVLVFRPGVRTFLLRTTGAVVRGAWRGTSAAVRFLGSDRAWKRFIRWTGRRRAAAGAGGAPAGGGKTSEETGEERPQDDAGSGNEAPLAR